MSNKEFEYWKAFNVLEPIGLFREDILFAGLGRTIADAMVPGHNLKLDNFMMFKEKQPMPKAEIQNNLKAFFSGYSKSKV
ncbi:phage tail assembly protein T [Acinetobacter baumannii]|nr:MULTISPECIES: hypothetical protein [Acinetobacter]HAV4232397.1 hypothetical protein [Acinetobacter baumannii ATCC 17978]AYX96200.1 hypothetical protein EGY13_07405 [Acinetobacter sp. FDAARGOS_493]EHU1227833.1 hypothetical protein [Acinetobacter baumannii]EHU1231582.1 hypothetical protein [Acinetobacter baumannii]EHU1243885.1 hypothetical protein [Acinetobacter baumannii]